MKPLLALVLLLPVALPVRADNAPAAAPAPAPSPAPELVELERILNDKQDAKSKGQVAPEEYQAFVRQFRPKLDASMGRVEPNPTNTGLHALIVSRLGDRGQALAGLDQALEKDPKNPELLTAKAQIYYEHNDFPRAAATARAAGKMAEVIFHMSEGRFAGDGAAQASGFRPLQPGAAPERDESSVPYKLAVRGSAKVNDVPDLPSTAILYGGIPMIPNATGLWGRASDGLVMQGTQWLGSAEVSGENGLAGVGKFGRKAVGKGLVAVGGVMEVLPAGAAWMADKQFRILSGDGSAVTEVSEKAYMLGKDAVVGFAHDTHVAATNWVELFALRKPTVYQALKATAHTEAILANFLPVGFAARGGEVGAAATEAMAGNVSRRALSVSQAALEVEEGAVAVQRLGPGAASRVEFISTDTARREAMRRAGIPTSQQPISQIKTVAGHQYIYDVDGRKFAVTQQTTDRVVGHTPHWEAGPIKSAGHDLDPLGRFRHANQGKIKVNYGTE